MIQSMITYESKDPNELRWDKQSVTIQELLHIFALDVQEGNSDDQIGEQAEHLAKKIEELVRKETIEDILYWGEEINYGLDEGVRIYAGVKGITL